ncbi:DUF418 domain-containing protein [Poritiphilus flavus]|uniref:DUF418 domain-containing protein n=1 Tax=Poritiphilus flavus TaxID=2697053 RepID=A0A6L9EG34_9FLAO|nr:DUF418 domain-containing protein [Poritiphilus flavus]NAS13633.1 DUF418 domain-containing protein [Poritiphilus flavus]
MTTTTPKKRLEIVDALRGFSLAGIVIVHIVENYVGAPTPEGAMEATHQGIADNIVDGFIFLLLRGKFFALFSFLFGLSFFLQMDSAYDRGEDFRARFFWRLMLLLGIGYLHHMFYRGDILTIYAVLGIFLIPFYKVSNKWLIALASLLFIGVGRFVIFAIFKDANLFFPGELTPASPLIANYFEILKTGTIQEVFYSNATEGHLMKADFQLGIFGRAYLTLGFFLLGLMVGRLGLFKNFIEHKKLVKNVLLWSIALFVVSIGLTILAFANLGPEVTFDNWLAMIGLTALDLNNIAMTFIILSLFVICYRMKKPRKWLSKFAPYGRMALSNYVFQSIAGTFLFFGWGLGYLGEIRNSYTFLIALGIIVVQMLLSKWWLRYFYYGPLEWIWRSLTYFRRYPFRKRKMIDKAVV